MCNLLAQNLLHRTTRDVELNGYTLPVGTRIVPQLCTVLFDEEIFPEPMRFKPERFLEKKENGCGYKLMKCEELIPFGVGKRQCLGESLARQELFLFTANLFHRYTVRLLKLHHCLRAKST